MHDRTQESTLASDIKAQSEILLETAKERVQEIDEEIRTLKRLEAERSELLQQIEHLERILGVKPRVQYVATERTIKPPRGRRATPDGRPIVSHIEDILEVEFPNPLHWQGIYAKLQERGIGESWKSPSGSVYMAIKNSDRIKQLRNGEYIIKRDVLPHMEEAVATQDQTA